jgi:ADP-ribose pyrophosphatase YjhB (NUDIX family)
VTPVRRLHPTAPVVGVGAVIATSEASIVLVRRAQPPLAGRWSLPGGAIELGETLVEAVKREALEETGLAVEVGPVVDVVDHVEIDTAGKTTYHFVIVDYLCFPRGGTLRPGDDVDDAVIADLDALDAYELTVPARQVIHRAMALFAKRRAT